MSSEVPSEAPDQPELDGLIPTQTGPPADVWDELLPHRPRLLALARRYGCPTDDVADVVQEALLRAALQPPALPEKSLAFLRTTVRNVVTNRYRDRRHLQDLTERAALHPQPLPGPEEQVCDHAEATWLYTQTLALRPREREVLLARAAGRTASQIALELQITRKAVDHLTRRARRALQALAVAGCALVCLVAAATHSSKAPPHRHVSHPPSGTPHHAQHHVALRAGQQATALRTPSPVLGDAVASNVGQAWAPR